jgi:4-amino-4-deoxychorismate lyase
MALLLETIKIENGVIHNLNYHQERCNKSRQKLLNINKILDLSLAISPPKKGLFRCRILYDTIIHDIQYIPYIPKKIASLKIVSSTIEYQYKYQNRKIFDILLKIHNKVDDIIIKKDGYLTDISYANIAFYDGIKWVTPKKPLLKGTMRAKLLDEGFLHPINITPEMLQNYKQIAILNALIGFNILTDINPQDI